MCHSAFGVRKGPWPRGSERLARDNVLFRGNGLEWRQIILKISLKLINDASLCAYEFALMGTVRSSNHSMSIL